MVRSERGASVLREFVAARIEGAPVTLLRSGPQVGEISELSVAAPAGLAGIHHFRVLAESEPRLKHLFWRHPGSTAAFDRVTHIAPCEGVGLHQGGKSPHLLYDVVLCAA